MSCTVQFPAHRVSRIDSDRIIRFLSVVVLALGVLALTGWVLNVPALTTFFPPFSQPMSVASAIVFVCLAASLWTRKHRICWLVVQAVALIVGVVVTLGRAGILPLEHAIVQAGDPAWNFVTVGLPVRMSATTSMSIGVLGAIGISVAAFPSRRGAASRRVLFSLLAFLILLTLVGFLYGITVLRSYGLGKEISIGSTVCLCMLFLAEIFRQPQEATLFPLFDPSPVGKVVRRILLLVFVIPVAVGGLVAVGERGGSLDPMHALLLTVTATILPLSVLVIHQGGVILGGESRMRENWKRHRDLIEHMFDGVLVFEEGTLPGQFLLTEINDAAAALLEVGRADVVGKELSETFKYNDEPRIAHALKEVKRTGQSMKLERLRYLGCGSPKWFNGALYLLSSGQLVFVIENITMQTQAEERIRDLGRFPDENPNPVVRVALDGSIDYSNAAGRALLGSWAGERGDRLPSESMQTLLQAWDSAEKTAVEVKEGTRTFELTIVPILSRGYINLYGRDISEEKSLAEKFMQAQKMEAIGRLAGGVAHDFNNILTIIGGYSDLVQAELIEGSRAREHVDEIAKATRRAAGLTAQLLAFSRKQVMVPKVLSLDNLVRAMESIIVRIVGEDIDVGVFLGAAGDIKADQGQVEQVLMNLVTNARDAMPDGGRLTIETSVHALTDEYCLAHPGVTSGNYARLDVSDTGHGMSPGVQSHLFEPFFTTKKHGEGTGLGLSTVYGIVKQSNGHITCYSEVGKGTIFSVYFPSTSEARDQLEVQSPKISTRGGGQTILLVEDEEMVRRYMQTLLENMGYGVIAASDGREALSAMETRASEVDLLITDVVLPQMSGKDLAQKLLSFLPELKVLYASGYTENVITHHGILDRGINFIQKPFSSQQLLAKICEILDKQ